MHPDSRVVIPHSTSQCDRQAIDHVRTQPLLAEGSKQKIVKAQRSNTANALILLAMPAVAQLPIVQNEKRQLKLKRVQSALEVRRLLQCTISHNG